MAISMHEMPTRSIHGAPLYGFGEGYTSHASPENLSKERGVCFTVSQSRSYTWILERSDIAVLEATFPCPWTVMQRSGSRSFTRLASRMMFSTRGECSSQPS